VPICQDMLGRVPAAQAQSHHRSFHNTALKPLCPPLLRHNWYYSTWLLGCAFDGAWCWVPWPCQTFGWGFLRVRRHHAPPLCRLPGSGAMSVLIYFFRQGTAPLSCSLWMQPWSHLYTCKLLQGCIHTYGIEGMRGIPGVHVIDGVPLLHPWAFASSPVTLPARQCAATLMQHLLCIHAWVNVKLTSLSCYNLDASG